MHGCHDNRATQCHQVRGVTFWSPPPPAYKKSPGIRVLTLHLVLRHHREETRRTGNRADCLLPAAPLAEAAVRLEQHQKADEALIPP